MLSNNLFWTTLVLPHFVPIQWDTNCECGCLISVWVWFYHISVSVKWFICSVWGIEHVRWVYSFSTIYCSSHSFSQTVGHWIWGQVSHLSVGVSFSRECATRKRFIYFSTGIRHVESDGPDISSTNKICRRAPVAWAPTNETAFERDLVTNETCVSR